MTVYIRNQRSGLYFLGPSPCHGMLDSQRRHIRWVPKHEATAFCGSSSDPGWGRREARRTIRHFSLKRTVVE